MNITLALDDEGELRAEFTHIENDIYAVSLSTMVPMHEDGFPGCGAPSRARRS